MESKPRLLWVDNGPMRPDIIDQDDPSLAWVENDIDPYTRDCECDGEECDPDSCPRFVDECARCGEFTGGGVILMDGGEVYCDECVEWVDASEVRA